MTSSSSNSNPNSNPSLSNSDARGGTSFFKWFVILILGLGFFGLLALGLVFYAFTPLIKVDESKGTVKLFGGLIDIDDQIEMEIKSGHFGNQIKKWSIRDNIEPRVDSSFRVEGLEDFESKSIDQIRIKARQGSFQFYSHAGKTMDWKCRGGETFGINSEIDGTSFEMKIDNEGAIACEISLPKNLRLNFQFDSVFAQFHWPLYEVRLSGKRAKVIVREKKQNSFRYKIPERIDKLGDFRSPQTSSAKVFEMSVDSGIIQRP